MTVREMMQKYNVKTITLNKMKIDGSFMGTITDELTKFSIKIYSVKEIGNNFDEESNIEAIDGKLFIGAKARVVLESKTLTA